MKRSALRTLVRNLIAASLPLVGAAECQQQASTATSDMAVSSDLMVCPAASAAPNCLSTVVYFDGGVTDGSSCQQLCPLSGQPWLCTLHSDRCGDWIECATCVLGRRPESLLPSPPPSATSEAGRYFAHAAHLEAAAIEAFEILALELEALGAPSSTASSIT